VDYQAIMDAASLVVDTRNAAARTRTSRARVVSLSATSTAGATQPAAPTRERPALAAR